MGSLFSFDKLITPSIIKIIFIISVVIIGFASLCIFVGGIEESSSVFIGFLAIIPAAIFFCIAVLVARISAEMTLVIFMIRDELAWQRLNASGAETTIPSTDAI